MQAHMDRAVPPETMASAVKYTNPSAHVGFGDMALHNFDVQRLRRQAEAEREHHARSRQLLAEFSGIRILVDFTLVDGADEDDGQSYRCNAEGETVPLSESTSQTYTCTEADVLTSSKRSYLKSTLMAEAEAWLEGALQVNPVSGSMSIPPYSETSCDSAGVAYACCQQFQPFTEVEDQDFVLFVTARPTSGATIAWALSCASDQYGRPISGACARASAPPPWPRAPWSGLTGPPPRDRTCQLRSRPPLYFVAAAAQAGGHRHPRGHARAGLLQQPIPLLPQARQRGPVGRGQRGGVRDGKWAHGDEDYYPERGGESQEALWLRQLAQCGSAAGGCGRKRYGLWRCPPPAPSFECGSSSPLRRRRPGTAGSHWEKRLLRNEIMTGTANHLPVYSSMTLALFEDMGWYTVDYSYAQDLKWGLDQGCTFPTDKCSSWDDRFFCDGTPKEGCSHDFTAVAQCNVVDYGSSLPSAFQYFSDPAKGGRDSYADYCPFFEAYSNGDCRNLGPSATSANSVLGEIIDPASRCFVGTATVTGPSSSDKPRCLKTRCSNGFLELQFSWDDSAWYSCPLEGGTVTTDLGDVECPAFDLMCTDAARGCPNSCSGHGECQEDGTCSCSPGFSGSNCSIAECPQSDGVECAGHGQCDSSTGECTCDPGFLGDSCSELVCSDSSGVECSGHGSCNATTAVRPLLPHPSAHRPRVLTAGAGAPLVWAQLCDCDPEYYGKDCGMRRCLQPCGDSSDPVRGACDTAHGACACTILPSSLEYYSGPDCNGSLAVRPPLRAFPSPAPQGAAQWQGNRAHCFCRCVSV